MDFVYDKPIFTQWTFAPAEPNETCSDGKKGDACRARAEKETTKYKENSIASIKHILKRTKKVHKILKNLNSGKYITLNASEKLKYVNYIANEIFQHLGGDAKLISAGSVEGALLAHTFITTSDTNAAKKKHNHHHR